MYSKKFSKRQAFGTGILCLWAGILVGVFDLVESWEQLNGAVKYFFRFVMIRVD